jgi:serine/threonine-protein kinase
MPVETVDRLVSLIQQYELLDPARLDEVSRDLAARCPEPQALAQELLKRDWLTPFQLNQLLTDRGDQLVRGDYVLLQRLGKGGMGQVFKARHRRHGIVAALKLIKQQKSDNPEMVRRFRREISAVVRLDHPNIVRIVDLADVGDTLFFAMEFLHGVDLAQLVRQRGRLPPEEVCEYGRMAALGLQHAHEHGLVHRDIKPGNLFLTANDRTIKILDFGLARLDDLAGGRSVTTLTELGHVMGTPDYIAPEQARNAHAADHRADLYSLGCVLYFLLAGQVPFPKGTLTQKLIQHQVDAPTPLGLLRLDVPPAIVAIVEKLMAKEPAERFQTAAALALAPDSGAATLVDTDLADLPPLPPEALTAGDLESTVAAAHPAPPTRRRRRGNDWRPVILAIILILAVLGLGALGLMKWLWEK